VFPNATDLEIAALLRAQWEEFGRWIAEFPILDRIAADPGRIEVVHPERLQALKDRHPAVLISGHFSNFDVMALAIVQSGVDCQITYRATNNPLVDRRIVANRRSYGVKLFAPKGLASARELFRALARGESIALMNDQKFNGGIAAPFFGRTAHTAPGPATYALHFGVPIQPMSVQRTGKANFRVMVHEPFHPENTGDHDADVEAAVRRINAFMEDRVLERPTEWF
jgi:KDO2-lipid IV(A) lauroyltransferase